MDGWMEMSNNLQSLFNSHEHGLQCAAVLEEPALSVLSALAFVRHQALCVVVVG